MVTPAHLVGDIIVLRVSGRTNAHLVGDIIVLEAVRVSVWH